MSKPHPPPHSHPHAHPHPPSHRHKRTAAPGEWASRNRSYVVTLGLIFAALAFVLWKLQGTGPDASALSSQGKWEWSWQEQQEQRPVWKSVLFYLSSGLGLIFLSTGLFASQGIVKKVASATSLSWVTFPIRLLALPVQLVLSVFDRKR